jgi:SAM-dependent methyltransferase
MAHSGADLRVVERVRSYYRTILPFYERENAARPDLEFWRSLCAAWRPAWVLELGAGGGRVTRVFAECARVVGVDISLEMLAAARARLAGSQAHLLAADMRRLAFRRRFDLIAAPNDPFSHLTTAAGRREALRGVASHLAPGGRFVVEGLYRRPAAPTDPSERFRSVDGTFEIGERWQPAGPKDVWRARYTYRRWDAAGEAVTATFVARAWDPAAVPSQFAAAGLEVEAVWGDFDRRPFTPEADRIILVARRRTKDE